MTQSRYQPPPVSWTPVPPPPPAPPPKKKRARWPWIVGGSVVALIVVAGVSGKKTSTTPTEPGRAEAAAPAAPQQVKTEAPAPTTTAPPAPPVVKTGKGDDVITIDRSGVKIVKFDCPRCSGNTILETDGAESLLVNTIGKYSGKHWVDVRDGSVTSTYTINATGAWTLSVGGIDQARVVTDGPITGSGDDVVIAQHAAKAAAITNKGKGNFIVEVVSLMRSTIDLAVNEIGGYSGTVPFNGPAIVQVVSEGSWTITPRT